MNTHQDNFPTPVHISVITKNTLSSSETLLKNLCSVTNDVIACGSGIGWTTPFDNPQKELMPYFTKQASSPNTHLLIAYYHNKDTNNESSNDGNDHSEDNDKDIVVLGSLQLTDSINKFRCDATRHRAELSCFFVSPHYRGRGIGYQLLSRVEEIVREKDIKKLILDCRSTQLDAIRLYERFGFKRYGSMKNYASMDGEVFHDGYFYDKDIQ